MSPFVRYSLLRFFLFAAVFCVLLAVGARGVVLLAGAVVVSAALSYLLLSGPRQVLVDRMAARAAARARGPRAPRRPDAASRDAEVEDAAVERTRHDRER